MKITRLRKLILPSVVSSLAYLLSPIALAEDWQRTVVFMKGQTQNGQDMFIRGGLDWDYALEEFGESCINQVNIDFCSIPLRHRVMADNPEREFDLYLDWYGKEDGQQTTSKKIEGSPLVWTTDSPDSDRSVAVDGYGYTPLNTFGDHYWMLDVDMDCDKTVDGWFELKSFISNGPEWEDTIKQSNTPYDSNNHFAQCGKLNVFERNENTAVIRDLPPPRSGDSNYLQMNMPNSQLGWGAGSAATALVNAEGTVWEGVFHFEAGQLDYKFAGNASWSHSFGDDDETADFPQTGQVEKRANASNVRVTIPQTGLYRMTFNDETLAYTLDFAEHVNQPPVAQAGADQTVLVNQVVQFNGTFSRDPDGEIVSYAWSFGGDEALATHSYALAGTYTETLTVIDDEGEVATDEVVITVVDEFSRCNGPGEAGQVGWMDNNESTIWNYAPGFYKKDGHWIGIIHVKADAQRVQIVGDFTERNNHPLELTKTPDGKFWWFKGTDFDICQTPQSGDLYRFKITWNNGTSTEIIDPAGRWQTQSWLPTAWSKVTVSDGYQWNDAAWQNQSKDFKDYSVYQLHAARFTNRNGGNHFQQVTEELDNDGQNDYLNELGVKAIQFLPISDFAGTNSWGYNPSSYYAIEGSFGSPDDFKRLVDTAHQNGIAVFLDVVYSHYDWNTDWNPLIALAPNTYGDGQTVWGPLVNFGNDVVDHFFAMNAKYLVEEYHIDGFRFDATRPIHAVADSEQWIFEHNPGNYGSCPEHNRNDHTHCGWEFLKKIRDEVKESNPDVYMIAEELPNDWFLTQDQGSMDAQWVAWYNNAMREVLQGGSLNRLHDAFNNNFGGVSSHSSWKGTDSLIYSESHDNVEKNEGNKGRVAARARDGKSMEMAMVGMAGTILARGTPMIFMGQEAAETHDFGWEAHTWGDRLALSAYETDPQQRKVLAFSKQLFNIRHSDADAFATGDIAVTSLWDPNGVVAFTRDGGKYIVVLNFKGTDWSNYDVHVRGNYREVLNTSWEEYNVNGQDEVSLGRNTQSIRGLEIPAYGVVVLKRD